MTTETNKIIAYKVFNSDWTCRGFQYEIGKTYEKSSKPVICKEGFHACKKLIDCFNYYSFNPYNKVAIVEIIGEIDEKEDKICTNKIHIKEEINWFQVLELVNIGKNNTGLGNTGYRNTGHWNTGDCNTGHWNTGDCNTGNRNTGNSNTGNSNTGHCNTGHCNTGNSNTGYRNTGHWNTGDCNTGNRNTGNSNTGHCNTGHCNTGHCNTGNKNTGDWNTGDWNTGDWNTGFFNTETPDTINIFNKPCSREVWIKIEKPDFIYFNLTEWIPESNMTEEEKEQNPSYKTTKGYLKKYEYKETFRNSWKNATEEDRKLVLDLPNFDNNIFKEISGIDVYKELGIEK